MLIRRATLLDGTVANIRCHRLITEVDAGLRARRGEEVIDAAFATVIPGLHDHHVHLRSAAAALASVPAGPPRVLTRADLVGALTRAAPGSDGWIRAVGYHESVAGPLDRAVLDAMRDPTANTADSSAATPVRVQDRSGALWIVNSAGLAQLGIPGHPDGRLFRGRGDSPPFPARRRPALHAVSQRLAAFGVTGLTDATPGQDAADVGSLAAACRSGELRQRLHCMADPDVGAVPGITLGPVKLILDDDTLDLDRLQDTARRVHARGRGLAVHCVTDSQLVVTVAALRAAGPHPLDRIEHAAVVPDDLLDQLAAIGATVVTQPNFVAERGDAYLSEVLPAEQHRLWRLRSLVCHRVEVALSTDMPFGDADPWAAMRAAVHRGTPGGAVLNAAERVSPRSALTMFLGHPDRPSRPRTVTPGQPADLCVLTAPPRHVLAELDCAMVGATIVGGRIAHLPERSPLS